VPEQVPADPVLAQRFVPAPGAPEALAELLVEFLSQRVHPQRPPVLLDAPFEIARPRVQRRQLLQYAQEGLPQVLPLDPAPLRGGLVLQQVAR
jgi:hypothetical protein